MHPKVDPAAPVSTRIAEVARRQHGVVTRQQLLAAGISAEQLKLRLAGGSLHPVHRGVYRVGHRAPSTDASYLAAVLACGENALLCGRAAAWVHRLLRRAPPIAEVVAPGRRVVPGVRTRRSKACGRDAANVRGIPITSVARTLVDLAAMVEPSALGRAVHEAQVLHGIAAPEVLPLLARSPNSPGAAKLRRVLTGDAEITMSGLERRFLALLRSEALPLPRTNARTGGRWVDCRWPARALTVELDGYRFHASRHAWERDRRREREAYARGDEFRRYTYGDGFERPAAMLRELGALLASD